MILLKPVDTDAGGDRVLPVWIGAQEAMSILVAIEGTPPPRPLAHDLMTAMLGELSASVDRVEVTHLEEGTFHARV
ncbi:MAG: bifunctional nuclease family protein, partial [Xanthomonas perforans]|nr:bifunctional nuclease family protein [Xanthomonas perforans]